MNRLYLMPIIGAGVKGDPRRPKYRDTFSPPYDWTMMDMGLEPACIVYVEGIDQTTHNTLVAFSDVVSPPENLDQQIGAALNATVNAIEALNIPAQWVQGSDTFRETIRVVAAIFQFLQALNQVTAERLLSGSVTLSTRYNQLPVDVRQQLQAAAAIMQFDTSALTANSTLRQIFKAMADQWGNRPISIGMQI